MTLELLVLGNVECHPKMRGGVWKSLICLSVLLLCRSQAQGSTQTDAHTRPRVTSLNLDDLGVGRGTPGCAPESRRGA